MSRIMPPLISAMLMTALAVVSWGTDLQNTEFTCSVCEKSTAFDVVISTNRLGASDLDTRPPEMDRSTLPYRVQRCPHCGFCAAEINDTIAGASDLVKTEPYVAIATDERFPELARQFLCAAYLLENAGHYCDAGWFALRAAWVCDDLDRGHELCRRRSIDLFQAAISTGATLYPNRETVNTILVDLLRRVSDFEQAQSQARAALEEAGSEYVRVILHFELKLIDDKDTKVHTQKEAASGF